MLVYQLRLESYKMRDQEKMLLKEPLQVGATLLKNRLVMPPMATEKSTGGEVSDGLVKYYAEKSKGGYFSLIIQEHSYVSPEGKASKNQVSVASDATIIGLKKIVTAVHDNGSKILLQLAHAGSAADENVTGLSPISCSAIPNMRGWTKGDIDEDFKTTSKMAKDSSGEKALALTLDEIQIVKEKFVKAALRAKQAGYDGCEVHSAHGYLLNQFYSPLTNQRTDEYTGQTLAGRIRLQKEIVQAIRAKVGANFLISLRLGACDYAEGGTTIEDSVLAAKILQEAGLDLLSISGGLCDYTNPTSKRQGWFSDISEAIKAQVSIPVLLSGGINDVDAAESLLAEGKADLIGVGRAVLKDSLWAEKAMS